MRNLHKIETLTDDMKWVILYIKSLSGAELYKVRVIGNKISYKYKTNDWVELTKKQFTDCISYGKQRSSLDQFNMNLLEN